MIITRLKIPLEETEYSALLKIANKELRSPIDQARFILRQELEKRGLLESGSSSLQAAEPKARGELDKN